MSAMLHWKATQLWYIGGANWTCWLSKDYKKAHEGGWVGKGTSWRVWGEFFEYHQNTWYKNSSKSEISQKF